MTLDMLGLIAQKDNDWSNLIYLLVVLVLPMLNSFGAKIRKWSASKEDAKSVKPAQANTLAKGIAKKLQPARPVVLPGERGVARAPRAAVRPKAPAQAASTPQKTAHEGTQVRPAFPSRPAKARRVHPKPSPAKVKAQPTPDQRAERLAATRKMAKRAPLASPPGKPAKRIARRALLLGRLDPHSLRSVVVLNEILQPPLALREGWPGDF